MQRRCFDIVAYTQDGTERIFRNVKDIHSLETALNIGSFIKAEIYQKDVPSMGQENANKIGCWSKADGWDYRVIIPKQVGSDLDFPSNYRYMPVRMRKWWQQ